MAVVRGGDFASGSYLDLSVVNKKQRFRDLARSQHARAAIDVNDFERRRELVQPERVPSGEERQASQIGRQLFRGHLGVLVECRDLHVIETLEHEQLHVRDRERGRLANDLNRARFMLGVAIHRRLERLDVRGQRAHSKALPGHDVHFGGLVRLGHRSIRVDRNPNVEQTHHP